MKQVVIIGGGASGLMAGIMAARNGASVTILEKCEKPGKKILATGNGRCNLTNLKQDLSCYHGDPEFIKTILNEFSSQDTLDFFHELGLWTKDRDGWIYPRTDQAQSVLALLLQEFTRLKGKVKTNEEVTEIKVSRQPKRFTVLTKGWHYDADAVIVASGTPASNIDGVSQDALTFAKAANHKVQEFRPSLVPLKCVRENYFAKWAGLRTQAELKLYTENAVLVQTERGELQLTDYGISGIPVFQLSSKAGELLEQGKKPYVEINFLPDESYESLLEEMGRISSRSFADSNKKSIDSANQNIRSIPKNIRPAELLTGLLPDKLIASFCGKKTSLEDVLKNAFCCKVRISSLGPLKQAQICAGGVHLQELTTKMESKHVPGLYFTGECCNTDGRCGGYNLQWAWSTGAIAGKSAAKED